MAFPTDLEIARRAQLKPVDDIASEMGLGMHLLEPYGEQVMKIKLDAAGRGQDHHDGRAGAGVPAHRQASDDSDPAAVDGADVRHQGWRGRRRL